MLFLPRYINVRDDTVTVCADFAMSHKYVIVNNLRRQETVVLFIAK